MLPCCGSALLASFEMHQRQIYRLADLLGMGQHYIDTPTIMDGYPLVIYQFALEHGPFEIVSVPISSMVMFHTYAIIYQRVIVDAKTY